MDIDRVLASGGYLLDKYPNRYKNLFGVWSKKMWKDQRDTWYSPSICHYWNRSGLSLLTYPPWKSTKLKQRNAIEKKHIDRPLKSFGWLTWSGGSRGPSLWLLLSLPGTLEPSSSPDPALRLLGFRLIPPQWIIACSDDQNGPNKNNPNSCATAVAAKSICDKYLLGKPQEWTEQGREQIQLLIAVFSAF